MTYDDQGESAKTHGCKTLFKSIQLWIWQAKGNIVNESTKHSKTNLLRLHPPWA
jgi:hypothetical protein